MPHSVERSLSVGYVVSYFHPFASGAERQALAQGLELVRRGHRVHVITRSVPGYPIDDEEYQGIFIHRWVRTWDRGPLFGLSFVAGVRRAIRRLRGELDLVHTHQALWEAVATGLVAGRPSGIPTLVQPASSGYYGEADELRRTRGSRVLRRIILRNTAFAAISAEIERQWLELGVPRDRLFRTASGVDADHFHPGTSRLEGGLLPAPARGLHGAHAPPEEPAAAARRLDAGRPPDTGQPRPDRPRCGPGGAQGAWPREQGIADRVQFVDAVADPADHLRAADVFALPSVAEGMSNSLLEAMATALPCVASGIGGNTDLIEDRRTGRLVAESTPDAWASTLVELIRNPAEASSLGAAARRLIEERFSLRVVVDRYLELYGQIIDGRLAR